MSLTKSLHPQTCAEIKDQLICAFKASHVEVVDNSFKHRNHRGAKENPHQGHFHVTLHAPELLSLSRVMQHRAIYTALDSIMNKIHALEITILDSPYNSNH